MSTCSGPLLEGRQGSTQKAYTGRVRETQAKTYLDHLATHDPVAAAAVFGASVPSAGAWLENHEGVPPLADQAFDIAAKRRMHLPLLVGPGQCQNRQAAATRGLA